MTKEKRPEYTSRVPGYRFVDMQEEQEAQLRTNPLIRRFAESRRTMCGDPYRRYGGVGSPLSRSNA